MSFTTTWSFGLGYDGWSWVDASTGDTNRTAPERTHVSGAFRSRVRVVTGGGACTCIGRHDSPTLNASITAGDDIVFEYTTSATPAGGGDQVVLQAHYTDTTIDQLVPSNAVGGPQTLNLTGGKTLDFIRIIHQVGFSANAFTYDSYRDFTEIRLTTDTEITPTAGSLKTPVSYVESQGADADGGAGGGAGGNIADISANGSYIYIASFNDLSQPTLIRISTALNADGTVVFEPGGGGRIGVRCGKQNDSVVWVAGSFDGTNTIEKSENAGGSFTVKNNTSGTIRTFEVGPDSDERVMAFDGDNYDLIQSTDDGATWTTVNGSVGVLMNSMVRTDIDPQEISTVNEAGATDGAYYSPSGGVELYDIQVAPYPNADGTKVDIVS